MRIFAFEKVIVAALLLSLAAMPLWAAAAGEEQPAAAAAAPGEPQYGGTLTVVTFKAHDETVRWDATLGKYQTNTFQSPFAESLLAGDVDTHGPRGSNEYLFNSIEFVPLQFARGQLAESWEITSDPPGIIFHIRPGVMWTGNEHIGMQPREFVAADAVHHLDRFRTSTHAADYYYLENVYADGDHKFVVEFNQGYSFWPFDLGYGTFAHHVAPETFEAPGGIQDWRNQVGTGPYILTDYVDGSTVAFERNPNYWDTTTIDGKEYQLPFTDEFVLPLIADESTRLAALRTGRIDWDTNLSVVSEATLDRTSPELLKYRHPRSSIFQVGFNSVREPFNDINVRRAMHFGTDQHTVAENFFQEYDLHAHPLREDAAGLFVPFEELPESSRELYTYDPERAKQMLADAGYPDGFRTVINTADILDWPTLAAAVKDQWSRIGVEAEVIVHDGAAIWPMLNPADEAARYQGALVFGNGNTMIPFHLAKCAGEHSYAVTGLDDPEYSALFAAAMAEMDYDKMSAMGRELFTMCIASATIIPLGDGHDITYVWPWVKNYFGEIETGFVSVGPIGARIWLDQALKQEMGY